MAPISGAVADSNERHRPHSVDLTLLRDSEADEELREAAQARAEALRAYVKQQGQALVFVQLDANFEPEGRLAPAAATAQRQGIAEARAALIAQTGASPGGDPALKRRYETIPYVSIRVTPESLERVFAAEAATAISEVGTSRPSLAVTSGVIDAPQAWVTAEGSGWAVAVIDSGIRRTHNFIAGKLVSEACYSDDSSTRESVCPGGAEESTASGSSASCTTLADCAHGMRVSGIAVGQAYSGQPNGPFDGIGRQADLIAVNASHIQTSATLCQQAGESSAPCLLYEDDDLIEGLERVYMLRNAFPVAAVNLSVGRGRNVGTCDAQKPPMTSIVDNLTSADIAVVAAAGNDADPDGPETYEDGIHWPACITNVISVGSTKNNDTLSDWSQAAPILDLLAPGNLVNSADIDSDDDFAFRGGTSMAAPHVSGAIAVLRSAHPTWRPETMRHALASTGTLINDARSGSTRQFPRIDLDAALDPPPGAVFQFIEYAGCSGSIAHYAVSWSSNQISAAQFDLDMKVGSGSFGDQYQGTASSHTISVGLSQQITLRLRGQNTVGWGPFAQTAFTSVSSCGPLQ